MNGMGSHQSALMIKDEWLTPPWIKKRLGDFDLDPCSPVNRPWDTAKNHYTIEDDGLSKEWIGRVWLNAPYGRECDKWLEKMANHGSGIALTFARTETKMFFKHVWYEADSMLFIKGRLTFHHVNGEVAKANSGAPSVLISYSQADTLHLQFSSIPGRLVLLCNRS